MIIVWGKDPATWSGVSELIVFYGGGATAPTPPTPPIVTARGNIDYDQVQLVVRLGTGPKFAMATGAFTSGHGVVVDSVTGSLKDSGAAPTSGTVTNTGGALTADQPVFGAGGADIKIGTKTGNTNVVVTQSGAATSGRVLLYDASGNAVASTVQGNGTKVQMASGSPTTGYVLIYDASGNAVPGTGPPLSNPLTTKGDILGFDSAANRIPVGSNTQVLTADSTQTLGVKWAAAASAGAITQISQSILGAPAASVTFATISGSYTTLRLVFVARSAQAAANDNVIVTVNSDTNTNYSRAYNQVSGTSAFVGQTQSVAPGSCAPVIIAAANATAGRAGTAIMEFPGYAGTTFFKAALCQSGYRDSSVNENLFIWWEWASTSAITQIVLTLSSAGNFATGSTFTLYGIT